MRPLILSCVTILIFCNICFASNSTPFFATRTDQAPTIDGMITETMWADHDAIVVHDQHANIDITLKACYDADRIYLLATYPDTTEDRLHRALIWNNETESYYDGPTREDVLVLKWNMSTHNNDLSLNADRPYRADIWFWKASRTDHAGYADDKIQYYTTTRNKQSQQIISASGKVFYLRRNADTGESAYMPSLQTEYVGDCVTKYRQTQTSGSRADIRAKGQWENGVWTIEFSRLLNTGNLDDVQMDTSNNYLFGVSRFEIAGRDQEPESQQPLYGCGDTSELLSLTFK